MRVPLRFRNFASRGFLPFLISLGFFLSVGCTKAKDESQIESNELPPAHQNKVVQTQTDLEGSFSTCAILPKSAIDATGLNALMTATIFPKGTFLQTDLTFAGSVVRRKLTLHNNETCTSPLIEFLGEGRFATGESETTPKVKTLDIKMHKVYGTTLSALSVLALNNEKYCGISNWATGKKINLTYLPCEYKLRNELFKTEFTIYKLEEDSRLFLGIRTYNEAVTSSLQTRATEFLPLPMIRVSSGSAFPEELESSELSARDQEFWVTKNTYLRARLAVVYPEGSTLIFAVKTEPSHGKLRLESNGNFKYTPDKLYGGNDSFEFNVAIGETVKSAKVFIKVETATLSTVADTCTERNAAVSANGIQIIQPTDIQVVPGSKSNKVSWNRAVATSYNLYWSTSPGVTKSSGKLMGVTSPLLHSGLLVGTRYYYAVTAVYCASESALSPEGSGSTPSEFLVQTLAMDNDSACALSTEGNIKCWGENTNGRLGLGNGSITDLYTPQLANFGGKTARFLAHSDSHSCAIMLADSSLWCWGSNSSGQLGLGDEAEHLAPQQVFDSPTVPLIVKSVYVTDGSTCAILNNDSLKCWGYNGYGRLGIGSYVRKNLPQPVNLGVDVNNNNLPFTAKSVHLNENQTCAVLSNDDLKCWGDNYYGQVGSNSSADDVTSPELVLTGAKVKSVQSGYEHKCAILMDDTLKCWGRNIDGQLGIGSNSYQITPQLVDLGTRTEASTTVTNKASALAISYSSSCVMLDDNTVKCWGENGSGNLGIGTTTDEETTPKPTLLAKKAKSIQATNSHACAVLVDNTVSCWGDNSNGRLGINSTNNSNTPVNVNLGLGIKAASVQVNSANTCAVLDSGYLKCWGINDDGQVGNGGVSSQAVTTPHDVILNPVGGTNAN